MEALRTFDLSFSSSSMPRNRQVLFHWKWIHISLRRPSVRHRFSESRYGFSVGMTCSLSLSLSSRLSGSPSPFLMCCFVRKWMSCHRFDCCRRPETGPPGSMAASADAPTFSGGSLFISDRSGEWSVVVGFFVCLFVCFLAHSICIGLCFGRVENGAG